MACNVAGTLTPAGQVLVNKMDYLPGGSTYGSGVAFFCRLSSSVTEESAAYFIPQQFYEIWNIFYL